MSSGRTQSSYFSNSMTYSTKWGEDLTAKFLLEYRSHACLWDYQHQLYKSKEAREDAYKSLVRAMDLPGLDVMAVRSKIRIIRNTYTLELKKVLYRFGGNDYYPSLAWFPIADSFLRDVIQLKTGPLNVAQATPTDPLADDIQIMEDDIPVESDQQELLAESPVYQQESENNLGERHFRNNRTRRKRQKTQLEVEMEQEEFLEQGFVTLRQPNSEGDEYDLFAKYIACQLRKMPIHHALVCQDHIHSFVIKQRQQIEQQKDTSRITKTEPQD